MFKRLITIILCIVIWVVSIPIVSSAADSEQLERAIGLAKILELVPDLDKKDLTTPVTRAEMALLVARSIRFDESSSSEVRYFNDLPMDHWAQSAINYLAEIGVISQAEDKLFRPNDQVSLDEAIKMLACIAGYKPYADVKGGYPGGYYDVARVHNMLRGVGRSGSVTVGDAIILTVNALCMNTYSVSGIKQDMQYYDENSDTLLERYWDIHEGNGTVWATDASSLKEDAPAVEDGVIIDSEKYAAGIVDTEQFLGQYVNFFYRDINNNKELLFCYAPSGKNDVIEILSDDFISYKGGKFRYNDENGRAKEVSVSSAAIVAKNGEILTKDISASFNIENGEFKLLDSDRDGIYDIVIIRGCELYVVNTVDIVGERIYADNMKDETKMIERKPGQKLRIYNESGSLEGISNGQVLNVYQSDKSLSVYVTDEKISGKLDAVSNDSDTFVSVNGIEYKMYNSCYETNKNSLKTGSSYVFKLDQFGKIAFLDFDSSTTDSMQFGYLVKAAASKGIKAAIECKIYTTENKMKVLSIDSKPRIDGEKVEQDRIITTLTSASESGVINQLIRYRLNDEGVICEIDTAKKNANEADNTLVKTFDKSTGGVTWGGNYGKFNRLGVFSGGASFTVPVQDSIATADDSDFSYKVSGTWSNGHSFDGVSLYSANSDNLSGNIAVIYSASGAGTEVNYPFLFDRITYGHDKDGFGMNIAHLFGDTEEEIFIAPEYEEQWNALGISRGDVIKITTNINGYINGTEIILDYSKDNLPSGMVQNGSYPFQAKDLSAGYVLRTKGNVVEWGYGTDLSQPFERLNVPSNQKIAVYDSTFRSGEVYIGTVNDILSAENVGDSPSGIMVYGETGNLRRIIVHKNGWKK